MTYHAHVGAVGTQENRAIAQCCPLTAMRLYAHVLYADVQLTMQPQAGMHLEFVTKAPMKSPQELAASKQAIVPHLVSNTIAALTGMVGASSVLLEGREA